MKLIGAVLLMLLSLCAQTNPSSSDEARKASGGKPQIGSSKDVARQSPEHSARVVYVLLVNDSEGVYTSVSETEARAFSDLVSYVRAKMEKEHLVLGADVKGDEDLVDWFFEDIHQDDGYEIRESDVLV